MTAARKAVLAATGSSIVALVLGAVPAAAQTIAQGDAEATGETQIVVIGLAAGRSNGGRQHCSG